MSNNDTVKSPTIPTPNSMVSPTNSTPTQNESRENKVKLSWNDQTETLLRSWSDISSCFTRLCSCRLYNIRPSRNWRCKYFHRYFNYITKLF